MGDDADLDSLAQRQHAELFELFDFFERRRRPGGEVEKEVAAVSVKAEMLEEGFFIRQIKDETSGQTRPVVEFE